MPILENETTLLARLLSIAERDEVFGELPPITGPSLALEKWLSRRPLHNTARYKDLLDHLGLSDERVRRLVTLGDDIDSIIGTEEKDDQCPKLKKLLTELLAYDPAVANRHFSDISGINSPNARFFDIINPLIMQAGKELKIGLARWEEETDHPVCTADEAFGMMIQDLPYKLFSYVYKVGILELNIFREQNKLEGETPEERFRSFLDKLRTKEYFNYLVHEYPGCYRQAHDYLRLWIHNNLELIERIQKDKEGIAEKILNSKSTGKLTGIEFSQGDSHNGGKAVSILDFEGKKVVYKPKNLAVEVQFQQFLLWYNSVREGELLKPLQIYSRATHGYMEFIPSAACNDINAYYRKLGAYLCILYVFNSYDQHYENIIASGDDPYFVDLETICSPQLDKMPAWKKLMGNSVLGSSILPRRIFEDNNDKVGTIVSGMANVKGEQSLIKSSILKNKNTDTLRVSQEKVGMPGGNNVPKSATNDTVNYEDYYDDVVSGFTKAYRTLQKHKKYLLQKDGLIDGFSDTEIRFLVRNTSDYTKLLADAHHPALLRDEAVRERHMNLLWNIVDEQPYMKPAIPAELKALKRNDVPFFYSRAGGTELLSRDCEPIEGFFSLSGVEAVRQKIDNLSETDLVNQLWLIELSIKGNNYRAQPFLKPLTTDYKLSGVKASAERVKAEIRQIADTLTATSMVLDNKAYWHTVTLRNNSAVVSPTMLDFNLGLPGIALFLQTAATYIDGKYQGIADKVLNTMVYHILEKHFHPFTGMMVGLGGLYYSLALIHSMRPVRDLEQCVHILHEYVEELITEDKDHDIVYGNAGIIIGLCSMYKVTKDTYFLSLAEKAGDRIIDNAQSMKEGCGWQVSEISAAHPLTGMSHGTAGIASALMWLGHYSEKSHYTETARKALSYERSQYDSEAGNWLDLRNEKPGLMTAWSHGSTGIGISRTIMLRESFIAGEAARQEVQQAIQDTLREGLGRNHIAINGDMGAIELLLQSSRVLQDKSLHDMAGSLLNSILDEKEASGWRTNNRLSIELPGFMEGLSGIGYQMIRYLFPNEIPGVLSLDMPNS